MLRIIFVVGLIAAGSCFLLENVLHLEVDCDSYKSKCDHNILEYLWQVCGSDGKTYPNSCDLAKAKCFQHLNVRIEHVGECRKSELSQASAAATSPPTPPPTASNQPTRAVLDIFCLQLGREDCPVTKEEVCGSDGKTYDNLCEFEKAACMHKSLTVKSFRICDI